MYTYNIFKWKPMCIVHNRQCSTECADRENSNTFLTNSTITSIPLNYHRIQNFLTQK